MILSIKTMGIAFLAGMLIGIGSGGYGAWKFQGMRIESMQAAEIKRVSGLKDELQKITETLIKQERENNDITLKLDKTATDAILRRSEDSATISRLLRSANSLRAGAISCEAKTGTPTSASSTTPDTAPVGRFSAEFQEYSADTLKRADEAADYANACYGYATEVMRQRERMKKDQE